MKIVISRKQFYRRQWTALIAGLDFSNTAPLPRAIAAVLNEIFKEEIKNDGNAV